MTVTDDYKPYSIEISSWAHIITARLMLEVVVRHDGDLTRIAASLGMSEAVIWQHIVDARTIELLNHPAAACVELSPDCWRRMLGQMVLAVVDEAPSRCATAPSSGSEPKLCAVESGGPD